MITLQQLLMTDSDLSGGTQTGKGADGAQDFLSLLAGALTDATGQGKDAPLTLADLKAAGGKLSKAALLQDGDSAIPSKLASLLARQDLFNADDASQAATAETTIQSLVSGLLPATHSDALKTLVADAQKEDSKSDLSEEDLAGLSALMAMLPHQQTATARATPANEVNAVTTQAALSQPGVGREAALNGDGSTLGKTKAPSTDVDSKLSASAQLTPVATAAAEKHEAASAFSSASPSASLSPIMTNGTTPPAPTNVASAPLLSQPLGTQEWQQAVSQHITLFTKQGQQSAELRLHPENLGQVQISIKMDDNQAQLQMISANGHVRSALEAALPMLRTQLAENGIQLSQSTISSDSSANQQQSSFQQQQHASRSGQQGEMSDENDELLITPAALQSAARGNGAVDIFA